MTIPLFPEQDRKSPLGDPLFPDNGKDPFGQAVRIGSQTPPDSAARVLRLQERTGLAPDLISRNLDEIEKQAASRDFDAERFRRESPIVSSWMAEHPTHAAAAMDDLSQLSKIEGALVALKRGFRIGREQSETGELGFEQLDKGSLSPEQKARLDALNADIAREPVGRSFFQTALFQSSKIAGQMIEGAPSALQYGTFGAGLGAAAGLAGGPLAPVSAGAGALAGFGVGATAGMAGYTFVVEAGQSYQDMKQVVSETGEKLSDGAMRAAATGVGAINAVLEIAGLHFIAKPFQKVAQKFASEVARDALVRPTMRAALSEFGKNYVGAIAGESTTEVLQEVSSITGEEFAKMVSNGHFASVMNDPEQRELAVQRLVDISRQTAEGMLLIGLPGASINLASDVMRARKATQRAEFYTALGEAVKESKTFERLPEKLQEIVQRATANGPIETAYVDVQPFIEYFQSQNLDPREVAREVMGSTDEYDQAVATRGAMAIPMAKYATRLAPTEHNAFFAREIRRAPDEINGREADELQAQAAEAAKIAPDEQAAVNARETLQNTVAQQIEATGRFKGADAQDLAKQMAAFFTTQGQRYRIDPLQLFNRYGLQVLRGEPTVPVVPRPANPLSDVDLQNSIEAGVERIVEERANADLDAGVGAAKSTRLRNASGVLPTKLEDATLQELADELTRLIDANQEDGELVVPTVSEEANVSHRDGYLAHHVGMKGQAIMASGRIAARNKSIARLEAAIKAKGADPMELYAKTAQGETLDGAADFNFGANAGETFDQAAFWRHLTESPAFKAWFRDSKVVDENGNPLVVFHGSQRSDRFGPVMMKNRATSGPMPFFTDDAKLASSYATNKIDTSIPDEEANYDAWYRLKLPGSRKAINLGQAWYRLTEEQRAAIAERAPQVTFDPEGSGAIIVEEGNKSGTGNYDYEIQRQRGNALKALVEEWLSSGNLFNDEFRFHEVLKLAGVPMDVVEYHHPYASLPGVTPAFLSIQNPFDTSTVDDAFIAKMEVASKRKRKRRVEGRGDAWSKDSVTAADWVDRLRDDEARGTTHAWTVIPDWVTETLQSLGYDGIKDVSGKNGGEVHTVWVPFDPGQVKSAIANRGTFDPNSPNILHQAAFHGSPHIFEKFSLHAIGSGEGAQAYGWGLYFAGKKEVAQWYRENLSGVRLTRTDGSAVTYTEARHEIAAAVRESQGWTEDHTGWLSTGSPDKAWAIAGEILAGLQEGADAAEYAKWLRRNRDVDDWAAKAVAAETASRAFAVSRDAGRLYKVEIPEDETYLDWDKPLREQPAVIREALDRSGFAKLLRNPTYEAARAYLIENIRAGAVDGRAEEAVALVERMLADKGQRTGTDDAVANYQALAKLVKGVDLNRIHDVADYGVDLAYTEKIADERLNQEAQDRLDDSEDRPQRPDASARDAGEDGWEAIVDGEGTGDFWDTEVEALVYAEDKAEAILTRMESERLTDIRNSLSYGEILSEVQRELGYINSPQFGESGQDLYEALSSTVGGPQMASKALGAIGITGIKYLDGSSRGTGEGTYNYVVFDDQLVQIVEYEQRQRGGEPRGRIRIMPDRKMAIDLLQGADFSTFLHESGHFYLEVLKDLAGENPENAADFQAILKFLDVQSADQIGREQHEKFARAIEAYFMEGKAPTIELRRAFHRFKAWLKALYASIRSLDVELNPQTRRVFDRLFATDAEIDAAENEAGIVPIFTTADAAGMSETEFAAYRQTVEDAHIQSTDKLRAKIMRDELRQQEAWWKAARAQIRSEVEGEVNQEPVYRALALLQRGEMPDGTKASEPIKLSREDIVEAKGVEFLKRLPRPYIYAKEGGISIDQAAELLGFSSGDELLTTIANAPNKTQVIEAETDRRMTAQYGDMVHDGKIVDEAEKSVLDEQRAQIIRDEIRALNRRARDVKPFVDAAKAEAKDQRREGQQILRGVPAIETVRQMAKDRIAQLQIRYIRPHTFWVAARKAGQEAFALAGKDDFVGAANAKQAELLNVELYREATRVRSETDSIAEYARSLMRSAAQKRLGKAGWEYREQINELLERFDFSPLPLSEGARRQSLAAFIKSQEDKGLPVNIPEDIQNEAFRTPWKDMTYEEIVGVRDVLKHIEHLSTLKNKLLSIAAQRALDEATADARRSIEEHAKKTLPVQVETRLPGEQAKRAVDGFFGAHRKLASLLREMDGFKDNGVMWNLIVRPLNAAADKKAELNAEITKKLSAIWDAHYSKAERAAMYRKEYFPPLHTSLTKMGRLMIALNWGAEDNREKLMNGLAISTGRSVLLSDVEAVIDTLDAKDMEFVQSIWDAIGDYWPQLEALAQRLDGVAPEKIEASPFRSRHGEHRGGYFPMVYDDRQSRVAHRNVVAKTADAIKRGAAARNSTKAGARNERVANVRMPVRLDFGVIFEHFEEIAQDITHTEALIDVGRIIGSDEVEDAVRAHYGDNAYKSILAALESIAAGDVPAQTWFDKSLNWIRVGTSIAGLGWNVTTSFLQPLGLTQSMVRIGPKWVGKGIARWIRDAASMENTAAWIQEKSPFMRTRTSTQMREIAEIRNRVGLASGRLATYVDMGISKVTLEKLDLQDVEDSYFWMITRMQLVADIPTWLGGYEKALASGVDEETAIALADQGVIDAQGSGSIKDLAEVQRGNPALKLWTNFYSFFNTTWNLHVEAIGRADMKNPKSIGRLAADLLLLSTVPAALGYILKRAVRGDEDDEDLAAALAKENLSYLVNMVVGVREIGSVIQGFHGYEGPAGARFFSEIGKLVKQVGQGDADQAAFRALNNSAGILLHYPAGQVQRTIEGFMALEEGRTRNPAALLFGAPRN